MNREQRSALAQETLRIINEGHYVNRSGQVVQLGEDIEKAIKASCLYRPSDFPEDLSVPMSPNAESARIEITAESTLEAARRICLEMPKVTPLCLNFASAKNPGGGFLSGSQAQEESLACSSALYPCLTQMIEMYDYNRAHTDCLYSDYMIYSPDVPVFRDDSGQLLDAPYSVAFISAPAVNAGAVRKNEPHNIAQIEPTLRRRMQRVLWVAGQQGHQMLILGAWGCGVFGNEPETVARLFAELLCADGPFSRHFQRVVFAVYDRSPEQAVLNALRSQLTEQPDNSRTNPRPGGRLAEGH